MEDAGATRAVAPNTTKRAFHACAPIYLYRVGSIYIVVFDFGVNQLLPSNVVPAQTSVAAASKLVHVRFRHGGQVTEYYFNYQDKKRPALK